MKDSNYIINESKLGRKVIVERLLSILDDEENVRALESDNLKLFIEDCFPIMDIGDTIKPLYKDDCSPKSDDYKDAVEAISDWGDPWKAMSDLREWLNYRLENEKHYTEEDAQTNYNYLIAMPTRLANFVLFNNANTGWMRDLLGKHSKATINNYERVITDDNLQDIKNDLMQELKALEK